MTEEEAKAAQEAAEKQAAEKAEQEAAAQGTSNSQGNPPPPAPDSGAAGASSASASEKQHAQPAVDNLIEKLRKEREAKTKPEPPKVERPQGSTETEQEPAEGQGRGPAPKVDEIKQPQNFYNFLAVGIVNGLDQIFPRLIKWAKAESDHKPYQADADQKKFLVDAWEAWFKFLQVKVTPFMTVLLANAIVYWQFFYGLFFIRGPLLVKGWFKKKPTQMDKIKQAQQQEAELQAKAKAEAEQRAAEAAAQRAAQAAEAKAKAEAEAQGLKKCAWQPCNEMTAKEFCCKSHAAKHREAEKKKNTKK